MEDFYLGSAAVKLFLPVFKMNFPEIVDIALPAEGVFHNLVFVSIRKTYPMQAYKIMHGLWGMGQMMFTKYLVVVDDDVDVHNTSEVLFRLCANTDPQRDSLFTKGPADVLDHATSEIAIGGKLGLDATRKLPGEGFKRPWPSLIRMDPAVKAKMDGCSIFDPPPARAGVLGHFGPSVRLTRGCLSGSIFRCPASPKTKAVPHAIVRRPGPQAHPCQHPFGFLSRPTLANRGPNQAPSSAKGSHAQTSQLLHCHCCRRFLPRRRLGRPAHLFDQPGPGLPPRRENRPGGHWPGSGRFLEYRLVQSRLKLEIRQRRGLFGHDFNPPWRLWQLLRVVRRHVRQLRL
jgi:hypothetical protein